jgi:hypothetical protein
MLRSSKWQGTTQQLLHSTCQLSKIPDTGVTFAANERRIFTVKPNSGVSPTVSRSAILTALTSVITPLLDGNTRESHPAGDWCIDPDPHAPSVAALLRLLQPGSIHLPIPGTSESALVSVDSALRLSPLSPLKLLFRQVPTELSGIGFVVAILGLAGYTVLTTSAGPLQVPLAGRVQIVKYCYEGHRQGHPTPR